MFSPFLWTTLLSSLILQVAASPLKVSVTSCASPSPNFPSVYLLNFTSAYAQFGPNAAGITGPAGQTGSHLLRLDLVGVTGADVQGFSNTTGKLATLFSSVALLTSPIISSTSSLCYSLSSPTLQDLPVDDPSSCIVPGGPIALNLTLPLPSSYPLSTLRTLVRIVDTAFPNPNELACVTVETSPFYEDGWYYSLILWLPAAVAALFWAVLWSARFWCGWRAGVKSKGVSTGKGKVLGTAVMSTVSGDALVTSASLVRFVTPGFRDIIFQIQFTSALAMIAVRWPLFVYPIAAKGAWASLLGNVTLVQGSSQRPDSLSTSYSPPSTFATLFTSSSSPYYLDTNVPNVLLNYDDLKPGIPSFARAVGLREQDLFGTSAAIFLLVCTALTLLSLLVWVVHGVGEYVFSQRVRNGGSSIDDAGPSLSPRLFRSALSNELDAQSSMGPDTPLPKTPGSAKEGFILSSAGQGGAAMAAQTPTRAVRRQWWKFNAKGGVGAFYARALQGNLTRLLLLFHLPITIFAAHHLTLSPSLSIASFVLAVIFLAVVCLALPVFLIFRIATTSSAKLYDATRTLLSYGPLYTLYSEGSQLYAAVLLGYSLGMGVVIGAGGGSGTAQTIILLLLEIVIALVTSIWLPWGQGAAMGGTSFVLCVLRIITLALVLILCDAVDVGASARAWLSYAVVVLQAFVFLLFLLILIVKTIELFTRLIISAPFDESNDPYDTGLLGALSRLSCCGPDLLRASGRRRKRRAKASGRREHKPSESASSSNGILLKGKGGSETDRSSTAGAPSAPGGYSLRPVGEGAPLDESGFIMGGWQGSSQAGSSASSYQSVQQRSTSHLDSAHQHVRRPSSPLSMADQQQQAPAPSGFSKIRGGRAAYETPYNLVPTVQSPPPAPAARPPRPPHSNSQGYFPRASPPLPAGASPSGSPPGSVSDRPRQHARRRSETAIVENYPPPSPSAYAVARGVVPHDRRPSYGQQQSQSISQVFSSSSASTGPPQRPARQTSKGKATRTRARSRDSISDDSDDTTRPAAPKRSSWFSRSKPDVDLSSEDEDVASPQGPKETLASPTTPPPPSSSRWPFGSGGGKKKHQPRASEPSMPVVLGAPLSPSISAPSLSSEPQPPRSFVVVRPGRPSADSTRRAGESRSADGHVGGGSQRPPMT